jgi:hypothetical protein
MKRFILLFLLLTVLSLPALATDITVSSFTVESSQITTSTVTLRIYYSGTIVDSLGNVVAGGALGSGDFYKAINCTNNTTTHVITCPSFVLRSTLDSSDPTVTVSGVLYDSRGSQRQILFSGWQIPVTLGTSVIYAQLNTYNAAPPQYPPQGNPTTDQVLSLINAVQPCANASDVMKGCVQLSAVPSGTPTAVSITDPRVSSIINYKDYGVACDGVQETATPLQNAINAIPAGGSLIIDALCNLKLGSTVTLSGKNNIVIEGSRGDSYGKNSPQITWAGATGGTIFRFINMNSSELSGFKFNMGTASIAVDVDQDQDRVMTCSISSGTTNLTCSDARFKTHDGFTDVGRTITINGTFTTTIASVTDTTHATVSVVAPSTFTSASTTLFSPYGNNVSSSDRFERLMFNKPTGATVATTGLRISYWSQNNNERHQIDRVSCTFGGNSGTSMTNGSCFKIGDATVGGGSNAFNISFIHPYWFGPTYGMNLYSGGFYYSFDGESNFATIDYQTTGSGKLTIINHRSEFARQFLNSVGADVDVQNSFLGNGSWDASYPLLYADNSFLSLRNVAFSYNLTPGIVGVDANPANNSKLQLEGTSFVNNNLTTNYTNFHQGVVGILPSDRVGIFLGGQTGVGSSLQMQGTDFANLNYMGGTGTEVYCTDCLRGSNPCVQGGLTGAWAVKDASAWRCTGLLQGSKTYAAPPLTDGSSDTTTVGVANAHAGNSCRAGLSTITTTGWTLKCDILANDTATVKIINNTGGAVTLSSGTLTVTVDQ